MKLVVSVRLEADGRAQVAGVGFDEWAQAEPALGEAWVSKLEGLSKPAKGEPDLREAACVQKLLADHRLAPELVLMDQPVYLDAQDTPGPGARVHAALGGAVPVIGIAKSAWKEPSAQHEVHREDETPPLMVTCAGVDLGAAKSRLRAMHGRKRVPTLVKLAARLAKGGD